MRADERLPILDAFRQRLGSVNLKHFWEDLMAVLPVVTPALSDEALLAHVIELQRVANRSEPVSRPLSLPDRVNEEVAHRKARIRPIRRDNAVARLVRIPKLKRDPNKLTIDKVAQLIRARRFAVQG